MRIIPLACLTILLSAACARAEEAAPSDDPAAAAPTPAPADSAPSEANAPAPAETAVTPAGASATTRFDTERRVRPSTRDMVEARRLYLRHGDQLEHTRVGWQPTAAPRRSPQEAQRAARQEAVVQERRDERASERREHLRDEQRRRATGETAANAPAPVAPPQSHAPGP